MSDTFRICSECEGSKTNHDPDCPRAPHPNATSEPRREAILAAMKVLDCERVRGDVGMGYCAEHNFGWLSDADCCPRAERVVNQVLAAMAAANVPAEREDVDR